MRDTQIDPTNPQAAVRAAKEKWLAAYGTHLLAASHAKAAKKAADEAFDEFQKALAGTGGLEL